MGGWQQLEQLQLEDDEISEELRRLEDQLSEQVLNAIALRVSQFLLQYIYSHILDIISMRKDLNCGLMQVTINKEHICYLENAVKKETESRY